MDIIHVTQQRERRTLEEEQVNVTGEGKAITQTTNSCEKHANNELKYYCEDHETVICGECIATEHGGHRISSVEQVAKSNRGKIKAVLVKTMKTTNRFKEAVAMEIAYETEDSHIRTDTVKNIEKQAQSLHKLIDQKVETLISEVNSAYENKKRQREKNKGILELHHTSLYSACDFAQELIVNGTDSDVMVHAKSLIERLVAMEKTPVPSPDTPAQILYSQGKISTAGLIAMLGQVTVQSQRSLPGEGTNPISAPVSPVFLEKAECVHSFSSKLIDDRKITIHGFAIDTEQMFVVDNENNRTKIFTHAGEFKHYIEISSPFDVTVSQTGHPYVTSVTDKYVKVFSTRGQLLATVGQDQLKEPWGITLNRQGYVMVCDRGKKSILVFHADSGQLLNTIPLSMCECPEYITVNNENDNIVISDWGNSCVHVLSPSGNLLYQYGTYGSGVGQMLIPQGVCTDSYGHIFIADRDNNRIVALSPQGQFIRYIATERDGMERPVALAINPAGQLVVAEREGKVKTFQYLQ